MLFFGYDTLRGTLLQAGRPGAGEHVAAGPTAFGGQEGRTGAGEELPYAQEGVRRLHRLCTPEDTASAQEVETLLVECVERGAGVEADTLASVVALLPEDLKAVLPEELRAAIGRSGAPAASAPAATAAPLVDYAPMPAATLETNQIGACGRSAPVAFDTQALLLLHGY